MKSPGFFSKQSDFSTSRPLATLVPEYYEPGESATDFDRGDFVLVKGAWTMDGPSGQLFDRGPRTPPQGQ